MGISALDWPEFFRTVLVTLNVVAAALILTLWWGSVRRLLRVAETPLAYTVALLSLAAIFLDRAFSSYEYLRADAPIPSSLLPLPILLGIFCVSLFLVIHRRAR